MDDELSLPSGGSAGGALASPSFWDTLGGAFSNTFNKALDVGGRYLESELTTKAELARLKGQAAIARENRLLGLQDASATAAIDITKIGGIAIVAGILIAVLFLFKKA